MVSVGFCTFKDNRSGQQGAGIFNEGKADVFESVFKHNEAHVSTWFNVKNCAAASADI